MGNKLISLFIIVLLSPFLFLRIQADDKKGIIINEVMPNPIGSDSLYEWVELYNYTDSDIDLTGWSFGNTIFDNLIIPAKEYLIIVRDLNSFPELDNKIKANFNLVNTSDEIILKDINNNIVDSFKYNNSTEGKSNERRGALCEGYDVNEFGDTISNLNSNYTQKCYENLIEEEVIIPLIISEFLPYSSDFEYIEIWNNSNSSVDSSKYKIIVNQSETISLGDCNGVISNQSYCIIILEEKLNDVEGQLDLVANDITLLSVQYSGSKLNQSFSLFQDEYYSDLPNSPGYPNTPTTLQISEVYPNLNTGEEEWIEIYNFGNFPIDLSNFYLTDNKKCSEITTPKKLATLLAPSQHIVFYKTQTAVTLNDDGDVIHLCSISKVEVDSFEYDESIKGKSLSRKFLEDRYDNLNYYITELTPLNINIIQEEITVYEDIYNAKRKSLGTIVNTEGFVSSQYDKLFSNTFYIQDNTGGIRVYFREPVALSLFQKVKISGKISEVNAEKRINAESIELIEEYRSYSPVILSIEMNLGDFIGTIVSTEGIIINNYSTSFDIQSPTGLIRVSILPSEIEVNKSKGDFVKVTGILSKDKDKYRILPFDSSHLLVIPQQTIEPIIKKTKTVIPDVKSEKNSVVLGTNHFKQPKIYSLSKESKQDSNFTPTILVTFSGVALVILTFIIRKELIQTFAELQNSSNRISLPKILP